MKYIKIILLALLVFGASLLMGRTVYAAPSDTESEITEAIMIFNSIESIPAVLPECDGICFNAKHEAYAKMPDARNLLLGQTVSEDGNILITFSVPRIEGIEESDIEKYDYLLTNFMDRRILMVTVEHLDREPGEPFAEAYLYVFSPEENPAVGLNFNGNIITVNMDRPALEIRLSSIAAASEPKLWTDDYTGKLTRTSSYMSCRASIADYAYDYIDSSSMGETRFDYGYVNMPSDMRSQLIGHMFSYNEYLAKKAEQEKWYSAMNKFWQNKAHTSFNLDAYAKSLGAKIENLPMEGDKEYRIGDYVIRLSYPDASSAESVEWSDISTNVSNSEFDVDAHCFKLRRDEETELIKVDSSNHHLGRWDFDYVVSLLEYCAKNCD